MTQINPENIRKNEYIRADWTGSNGWPRATEYVAQRDGDCDTAYGAPATYTRLKRELPQGIGAVIGYTFGLAQVIYTRTSNNQWVARGAGYICGNSYFKDNNYTILSEGVKL